jgi:hypothetical protein
MGSSADNSAVFHPAEAAKTGSAFRDFAFMDAQAAGHAVHGIRRGLGQVERPSTPLVDLFDFRPDPVKMGPNTVGTKADGIGNGPGTLLTIVAGSHKNE